MQICVPSPAPKTVTNAVERWEKRENSRLFVMSTESTLSRSLVDAVFRERHYLEGPDRLDVIVDCSGGDIGAAYQLVTLFRSFTKEFRVFVPDWAKSATTLFCLGADEIWMSRAAELGPLDAQIPDPRDPDDTISALEEFQAVDYLRTTAFEILDQSMRQLIRGTDMRVRDILAEASKFAAALVEPLYAQVDPLHFGAAHRSLQNSIEYGKRVMSRYAYREWSEAQISDCLEKLTWNYPSHGFVIDIDEAQELGLYAKLMSGEREHDAHIIMDEMQDCIGFLGVEVDRSSGNTREAGRKDDSEEHAKILQQVNGQEPDQEQNLEASANS